MELLIPYLIIINALGLPIMLADKRRAQKKHWRIPEATLMGIAAAGGSLGIFLGIYLFRHKTRNPKFTVGVPVLMGVQTILFYLL